MNAFSHVPPGFRFHPTDEELVDYYLRKKVQLKRIDLDIIKDVDLYKIEPWDLQERCKIGTEDQNDWFFFSHKDKKYPTGTRTNRATTAGFWKATGRDKPIYVKHCLVGMRKTLVFYKGRAPNGQKLDWIMHEYRLETNENGAPHDEGWVVCKVFKKRVATVQRMATVDSPFWFNHDHAAFMAPHVDSPRQAVHHDHAAFMAPHVDSPRQAVHHLQNAAYHHGHHQTYHHPCKVELEYHHLLPQEPASFLQITQLEMPRLPDLIGAVAASLQPCNQTHDSQASRQLENEPVYVTDASAGEWRDLDKFMASQLSHDGSTPKESSSYANPALSFQAEGKHEEALDYVSASASSGGNNGLWK